MLDKLEKLPDDPILGLAAQARADSNPEKIDLSIGIYQDEDGNCPVFEAVRLAQQEITAKEQTKAYLPADGDPQFLEHVPRLVLGDNHPALAAGRVSTIQTPGGCGALCLGAQVIQTAKEDARVLLSDPTWPNHIPLIGQVGLPLETYRYYQADTHSVNFDAMVEDLAGAGPGDVLLLHGCCHNPCGADLSLEQWSVIAEMAERQGFMPFVDTAYQGLGDGLDEDAAGLRLLAERVPEMIIASSCSKNMGLYRERVGSTIFVCKDSDSAEAMLSQAKAAARRIYSMPPAHGGIIAGKVLSDQNLNRSWKSELAQMCTRVNSVRQQLVEGLSAATGRDFSFIAREKGMFSFLGLTKEQAVELRQKHSVYMTDSSRINVAGVNSRNINYLVKSVAEVLAD